MANNSDAKNGLKQAVKKNVANKSANSNKNTNNGSLFTKSFKALSANPKAFLYMFLLDLGFLAVFLLLNFLINLIVPADPAFMTRLQQDMMLLIGIILLILIYILLIILVYSFFTLIILGNIKSLSVGHEHDFSMFKNMFLLNLLLFGIFFVMLMIFNILFTLLGNTSNWIGIFITVVFVILGILAYAFYNFTHSAFIMDHEIASSLKYGAKHLFTKSYLGIIMFSLGVLVAFSAVYFATGLLFKDFILNNYEEFVNISSIITIIIVYLLFSFNRIYFFFVAEKHIGHKR